MPRNALKSRRWLGSRYWRGATASWDQNVRRITGADEKRQDFGYLRQMKMKDLFQPS